MSNVFAKLNLKGQETIVVLNAPLSFESEIAGLDDVKVDRRVKAGPVEFGLAFATTQRQLDDACTALTAKASDDIILWIAYPKQTSRRYKCEFNRDSGWTVLGKAGFEGVRSVAIDEDWSALRFRRVKHIKTMTRSVKNTLSAEGKRRTGKKGHR
jgi:hypothetical protein